MDNVRQGTYTEQIELTSLNGSSAANRIIFQNDPEKIQLKLNYHLLGLVTQITRYLILLSYKFLIFLTLFMINENTIYAKEPLGASDKGRSMAIKGLNFIIYLPIIY